MQIHEITLAQLNEGIGQDIKSAITTPIKKAATVMNTPGALTSASGYATAMNKYYQDDNARLQAQFDQKKSSRLAAQTQQRAAQLAQQWIQQVQAKKPTGPIRAAPSAPTPLKPTGKYATNRNAGQVVNPTPAGLLPEAQGYLPTPAEQAKLQQKVADAEASANPPKGFAGQNWTQDKKTKKWSKISSDPAAGNAVNPAVTANPKTVMTGNRANEFKAWVDKQLTSQVTGTNQTVGMAQVRQDPETLRQLNALLPTIIMKNDPKAIEQYLTIAMTAMQKLSTEIRQSQKSSNRSGATSVSPLSMLISPENQEKIRTMVQQDPVKAAAIKQALGFK
jgi:hypothetical protein